MDSAETFLQTGQKFRLGFLETEKPNPLTTQLSRLAESDLPQAIAQMVEVDRQALAQLESKASGLLELGAAVRQARAQGGRIFLCGCGATGRLSLTLEFLARQAAEAAGVTPDVVGFMAGGDVALVHSLEGFEDFPDYGERHLRELGFGERDLLIAPTEGGETPYVIGAVEAAAKISAQAPYFLYCNPDELLMKIERSRRVLENPNIRKLNLSVGPMALAGSTRMQASTVLQLAIGFALFDLKGAALSDFLKRLTALLEENAAAFLTPFIEREAREYQEGRFVLYRVRDYAITVFTDTTERAPTFSLTPFSHRRAERLLKLKPSLCYVSLPGAKNATEAWRQLLGREARPLNWLDRDERTGEEYLREFDFSKGAREFRKWLTHDAEHTDFEIFRHEDGLLWRFQDVEMSVIWPRVSAEAGAQVLFEHTFLKMLLNIHSTLIMGRMGRYKSNLMTWVYPTNGKLIDRATRYVQTLLQEEGVEASYEDIVRELFAVRQRVTANDSIVLATCAALSSRS